MFYFLLTEFPSTWFQSCINSTCHCAITANAQISVVRFANFSFCERRQRRVTNRNEKTICRRQPMQQQIQTVVECVSDIARIHLHVCVMTKQQTHSHECILYLNVFLFRSLYVTQSISSAGLVFLSPNQKTYDPKGKVSGGSGGQNARDYPGMCSSSRRTAHKPVYIHYPRITVKAGTRWGFVHISYTYARPSRGIRKAVSRTYNAVIIIIFIIWRTRSRSDRSNIIQIAVVTSSTRFRLCDIG